MNRLLTPRLLAVLLVLLTVIAYVPALSAGYIWDDDTLLTANPQVRTLEGLREIWTGEHCRDYTPLTLTSFWAEWHLWGLEPMGYHAVNILLHALAALLLWRILERLLVPAWPGAWLAAAMFAVHPVNAASVAWIAERKNTLSGALFLGSILCYLAWRDEKRRGYYAASIGLFLLAALSKGSVVTLPAVLVLCVLWKERKWRLRDALEIIPHTAVAGAAALLTIRFQARAFHYGLIPDTPDYRIARAGAAVWMYVAALLMPVGMSPMREHWRPDLHSVAAYLPALAVGAVMALLFWKRHTGWGRGLLFGWIYFLFMLLPVLGLVWMTFMQESPSADWWQYMAAPGLLACAGAAASKWRIAVPLCCVALVFFLIQTWRRASIYHSMATYCATVTEEDPQAWTLQNNLGILFKRAGHFAEAEACYRQALTDNPGFVEAHVNMANAMAADHDLAGAETELLHAQEMRPGDPAITADLVGVYESKGAAAVSGDPAKAGEEFRRALALAPASIPLRIELCQALVRAGRKGEALKVCDEVDGLAREAGSAEARDAAARLRRDCER